MRMARGTVTPLRDTLARGAAYESTYGRTAPRRLRAYPPAHSLSLMRASPPPPAHSTIRLAADCTRRPCFLLCPSVRVYDSRRNTRSCKEPLRVYLVSWYFPHKNRKKSRSPRKREQRFIGPRKTLPKRNRYFHNGHNGRNGFLCPLSEA